MNPNSTATPRKPSGSSSNSGGQSPIASPGSHKLASSNNMFGVSMSSGASLKNLTSSWQVFTNGTANSKRTASMSSVTSLNEATSVEPSFRSNVVPAWNTSRQAGSWDIGSSSISNGDIGSPQKKDAIQVDNHSPNHPYVLQQTRQRQATAAHAAALSAPRIVNLGHEDDRRLLDDGTDRASKSASFSPQRFDNATKNTSPTRPNGYIAPFTASSNGQSVHTTGNRTSYDDSTSQSGQNVDELALGVRGMAVEDDHPSNSGGTFYRPQYSHHMQPVPPASGFNVPQIRPPPPMQPTRPPYGPYPQDYPNYYPANAPSRESFPLEYPYSYDSYRNHNDANIYGSGAPTNVASSPGGLYPPVPAQPIHPAHDIHHRNPSGLFYEYNGAPRTSGSQYFYSPHQPIVYHPPPAHAGIPNGIPTPQLAAVAVGNPTENKKREFQNMQYSIQSQHHQLSHQQNLILTSMRHSTPSPHSQPYPTSIEYTGQLPVLLGANVIPATSVYSHGVNSPHAMHLYPNLRPGRRLDVGSSAPLRSVLLDEFRANKTRKWELRDIFGYIVEFSGDQHGSRFIQQKLETASSEEKQIVFDEIVPNNALQLIQDVFGNYVIQKLFEHGIQVHKTQLASAMENHILALSLQMYGCRVVQKAIECILPEQQAVFVKELDSHVLKCVKDANGNHVIQKLIERVSPDKLGFVNAFRGNVHELSTHPYGCRVLQRCFEHLTEGQNRPLLDELHKYTVSLMQDQFGNYVIQFVLEHGRPEDKSLIISKLRGQMLHMAKHKFASNVCEKALVVADSEQRRLLIDEMMTPKQDGIIPIVAMMKDQFANYVLQRSLMVVEGDQKAELVNKIRPQLVNMRRYSSAYSKHLISIERLLEKAKPVEELDTSPDGKA